MVYLYFIVCQTCKRAEWWDKEQLSTFIEGHEGHNFTMMTPDTFEEPDTFREWFLTFMGWPVKEVKE